MRDYGTAAWKGGDAGCDHVQKQTTNGHSNSPVFHSTGEAFKNKAGIPYRDLCRKCGARRIDRQLGLEPTPEAYVAGMVAVFREVRRVLRSDGTCWVNLGDSYASSGGRQSGSGDTERGQLSKPHETIAGRSPLTIGNVPSKNLVGIPWRIAFALQADGWYLRSDIIWHKPNPMPESVRDRPTKSHEYVFLLTKRARYFYDADAVREKAEYGRSTESQRIWSRSGVPSEVATRPAHSTSIPGNGGSRNLRSVWTITPKPFKGAHFATFPPALVERCVKAGTSERGACPHCGKPWVRVTETHYEKARGGTTGFAKNSHEPNGRQNGTGMAGKPSLNRIDTTLGFRPACTCHGHFETIDADPDNLHAEPSRVYVPDGPQPEPVPCLVLDPFSGAGTVPLVAKQLNRDAIGIELKPAYNRMARKRLAACSPPASVTSSTASCSTSTASGTIRTCCAPKRPACPSPSGARSVST